MYRKYFVAFVENIEDEIFEATGVQMTEPLEVALYPLYVLLFTVEEFDPDLVDLLWWGLEGV